VEEGPSFVEVVKAEAREREVIGGQVVQLGSLSVRIVSWGRERIKRDRSFVQTEGLESQA